jgi:RND family efflux transporter MFP subunit
MTEKRHANLAIHSGENAEELHQIHRMQTMRRVKITTVGILAMLFVGGIGAFIARHSQAETAAANSKLQTKQYVMTVRAKSNTDGQNLLLPGTLQGYIEAPIAARISGYVMRWTKDIGSRVSKGDLLAEISNPETDQQLAQAVAARPQLVSALDLAKVSMERWDNLFAQKAVSQQEYDERRNAYLQAKSNLEAGDANIQRLKDMESYKRIVAPFSGVVTRRNVNIGDLIDAGAGRVLFSMAQTDPLRVYVYVPQSYAPQVKVGETVTITQAELPGQSFKGKVVRTAGAIDVVNRSLQTEISLPNSEGKLLPGAYVSVSLPANASNTLIVPTNTLLLRAEGPRIGVVDNTGHVHLHPVVIGQDFGLNVQILSGITATDNIVLNPSDSLADGDVVTVVHPEQKKQGS